MSPKLLYGACALLILLATGSGCAEGERPAPRASRNLILVAFDSVRFDAFQLAAEPDPREDRAAWIERTLRFSNVLANAPWTLPSVATVLTGRDPVMHGAGRFASEVANLDREVPTALSREVPTLAERLRDRGYETVAVVANPWFTSGFGLERGFDSLTELDRQRDVQGEASKWLSWRTARADAPPFFLYLHFDESRRSRSWTFERRRKLERSLLPTTAEKALALAPGDTCTDRASVACSTWLAYVFSIAEQMASLALVLETLEETGQLEQTIVILYSDHGEEFGDHAQAERVRGVDPRGVYGVGHGHTLYQEQLHVPLWVWHPEMDGGEVLAPMTLADVLPTALDWLGLDAVEGLEGRSAVPWVAGGPPAIDRPMFATGIAFGPEQVSLVRLPWKRIWSGPGAGSLFSIPHDPRETEPVDDAAVGEALDAQIEAWRSRDAPAPAPAPALSPEQWVRLRSELPVASATSD